MFTWTLDLCIHCIGLPVQSAWCVLVFPGLPICNLLCSVLAKLAHGIDTLYSITLLVAKRRYFPATRFNVQAGADITYQAD